MPLACCQKLDKRCRNLQKNKLIEKNCTFIDCIKINNTFVPRLFVKGGNTPQLGQNKKTKKQK